MAPDAGVVEPDDARVFLTPLRFRDGSPIVVEPTAVRTRTSAALLALLHASACRNEAGSQEAAGSEGSEATLSTGSTGTVSTLSGEEGSGADAVGEEILFDVHGGGGSGGDPPDIPPGTDPYGPCFDVLYEPNLWPPDVCPGATVCNHWGDNHPDNCWVVGKCSYTCVVDSDCPVPATGEALVECVGDLCRLFCDGCLPCPDGMICADSPILPDDRPECVWLEAPMGVECTAARPATVPGPCPERPS